MAAGTHAGRRRSALASLAFVCLAVSPLFAQDTATEAPPAHISFVDGAAVLERDGKSDNSPSSMPLLAGDRIRTQSGRVEILFADGSALHIDNHTVVDFQSDEVVRLLDGRLRLSIAGQGRGLAYRIDAPAAWVEVAEAGEYRIAVLRGEREPQVELAVLRGAAELVNEDGRSLVRAGERAFASAGARPSPPYVFNSAAWDAFDRWSEARRDQRLGVSAQYLPSDVRPYSAAFDHYGSWRYEQVHGYVWYPRVHVDWRPYYHGRWARLRPYGWTWIAADPWGWPTHHYGRWGFSTGSWFWIPGRRWGAAWVSWAHAPGYVSWCPLGWNDRPVFSFINANLYGGRRYDPWRAWTVVPRRHFGSGFVNVNIVSPARIDSRIHRSFVVRDRGPEGDYAVPRASTAIRAAGTRTGYAIPRGSTNSAASAPRYDGAAPDARSLPSPARQPRSVTGSTAERSSPPVTSAPQRAVPRTRTVERDTLPSSSIDGTDASSRVLHPRRESREGARRAEEPSTAPPAGARAVPRRSGDDVAPQRSVEQPAWGRYDRPDRPVQRNAPEYRSERPVQRSAPEYRSEPGARPETGYRRAPERDSPSERYRAIPRQDSPRPSYEPPRASEPPRSDPPRSYGSMPRQESRPPSYGSAPERRGPSSSPSADRPSRSAPQNEGGQPRSRGGQPSQGQATRRPRG